MKFTVTIRVCGFNGVLTCESEAEDQDELWDMLTEQIGHIKINDCDIAISEHITNETDEPEKDAL